MPSPSVEAKHGVEVLHAAIDVLGQPRQVRLEARQLVRGPLVVEERVREAVALLGRVQKGVDVHDALAHLGDRLRIGELLDRRRRAIGDALGVVEHRGGLLHHLVEVGRRRRLDVPAVGDGRRRGRSRR